VTRIYIDVDGILAQFVPALLKNYNQKHGTSLTPNDVTDWAFKGIFKHGQHWWDYTYPENFWTELETYSWAHALVAAAKATGKPYAFLTALQDVEDRRSVMSRKAWLDKHFTVDPTDIPSKRLIVAQRKELVVTEGDILIDDYIKNLWAAQKVGATVFLLAQPWNQGDFPERMTPEQILTALQVLK